jgi:hypothetical protein
MSEIKKNDKNQDQVLENDVQLNDEQLDEVSGARTQPLYGIPPIRD